MLIQVNTDSHISGSRRLIDQVEAVVEGTLGRFGDRITRIEVHITDESSSSKSGDNDKRCVMEARLSGRRPISASHRAASLEQAVDGAANKLERALKRTLGRLYDPKGRTSYGGDQTS
jgi:ribosome-associated translation inhibitor RaiA